MSEPSQDTPSYPSLLAHRRLLKIFLSCVGRSKTGALASDGSPAAALSLISRLRLGRTNTGAERWGGAQTHTKPIFTQRQQQFGENQLCLVYKVSPQQ